MPKIKRNYTSHVRQKQAEDTKKRILSAAENLIKEHGFEQTTIGMIAAKAKVATQTVYAVFGSKQGILTHILQNAASLPAMQPKVFMTGDDVKDTRKVAKKIAEVVRKRSEDAHSVFNSFGGVEILYPEVAALVQAADACRRQLIKDGFGLFSEDALAGLELEKRRARKQKLDLIWTLTDTSLYYRLVEHSGWSVEEYEKAMAQLYWFVFEQMNFD